MDVGARCEKAEGLRGATIGIESRGTAKDEYARGRRGGQAYLDDDLSEHFAKRLQFAGEPFGFPQGELSEEREMLGVQFDPRASGIGNRRHPLGRDARWGQDQEERREDRPAGTEAAQANHLSCISFLGVGSQAGIATSRAATRDVSTKQPDTWNFVDNGPSQAELRSVHSATSRRNGGRTMRGKNVARILFAVAVTAVVTTLALPTSAVGTTGKLTRTPRAERPKPNWNTLAIRDCADRYDGKIDFNVYFTCSCLVRGAETAGEGVAASAQCRQALSYQ